MSKYNSERTTIGGETFDSRKEAERWVVLRAKEGRGEISGLRRQVKFVLIPAQYRTEINGRTRCVEKEIAYYADFVYVRDGQTIVEDVKGYRGGSAYSMFKMKKKLMLFMHKIEVVEI